MSKTSQRNKTLKKRRDERARADWKILSTDEVKVFKEFLYEKGVVSSAERARLASILLKSRCDLSTALSGIERWGVDGMYAYLEEKYPDALSAINAFCQKCDGGNFRLSFGQGISEFFYQVALTRGCCGYLDGETTFRGKIVKSRV
jgi:hypothetical protein